MIWNCTPSRFVTLWCIHNLISNGRISGASQPPGTLELQLTRTAGSHPLHAVVGRLFLNHLRESVLQIPTRQPLAAGVRERS